MPSLNEVENFIHENFSNITISKKGTHFNAKCPLCGDSKKSLIKKRFHLQFNSEQEIIFNCFNCNESGNFYKLYSLLNNITEEEAWKKFNSYSSNRIINKLKQKPKISNKQKSKTENFNFILNDCLSIGDLPEGYIQKKYLKELKKFKETRKINQKIFIAYKGMYQGRIIIPVYDGEDIIYFQGRRINSKMEPKYLNPISKKEEIIVNKGNFDRNKKIIIAEGIIDADTIGNQGTCLLGKELKEEFFRKLYHTYKEGIILLMDNDEDGIKKLKEYSKIYKNLCKYFIMPDKYKMYKDLNELVSNNINISDMYSFVVENSFSYLQVEFILNAKRS